MPDTHIRLHTDVRADALVELGELLRDAGYAFVTVTPETHHTALARSGVRARSLRDVFGWNRAFDASLLGAEMCDALSEAGALVPCDDGYRSAVRFATFGGDIFVHSSFPTEDTDSVFFGPDTYRFLSFVESEGRLGGHVVDVGTGSGAAGLVASRRAGHVTLTDINERALDYARVNARLARAQDVSYALGDLLSAVPGDVDTVLANPPFMRDTLGRAYRDGGGEHGELLSVRIVTESLARLRPGGKLLLYTGACIVEGRDTFFEAAAPLLHEAREVRYREMDPDIFGESLREPAYADVDRIAAVALAVTR